METACGDVETRVKSLLLTFGLDHANELLETLQLYHRSKEGLLGMHNKNNARVAFVDN